MKKKEKKTLTVDLTRLGVDEISEAVGVWIPEAGVPKKEVLRKKDANKK